MLCLRSRDRVSGASSSDFRIKLNQPIQGAFYLSHVLIPNTAYTVRADCNALALARRLSHGMLQGQDRLPVLQGVLAHELVLGPLGALLVGGTHHDAAHVALPVDSGI